jgi:hypothetical protein
MLTGIAFDQPLDPHENTRAARTIFERIDPLGVLVCLLYSHAASVAQRLQVSTL